jgi:hypothetical protein
MAKIEQCGTGSCADRTIDRGIGLLGACQSVASRLHSSVGGGPSQRPPLEESTIMNANTLAHLTSHAPAAYELLRRIGLERRRSQGRRAASCAGLVGLGVVLGGTAALLLAPRNGEHLRERLGEQARRARDFLTPATRHDSPDRRSTPNAHAS